MDQPMRERATPFVQWHVRTTSADTAQWLTLVSIVGLAAAGLLAVVGGLPFELPMPTYRFGVVTPTCGLTRGSTAIARGEFALAWAYNPASFLVMGFGAVGLTLVGVAQATGQWIMINCTRSRSAWALIGLAIAALWMYQQSNADFIITSRR